MVILIIVDPLWLMGYGKDPLWLMCHGKGPLWLMGYGKDPLWLRKCINRYVTVK